MTRRFDVFLSHSSDDALWVQRLAADLERYEVSVAPDETQREQDGQSGPPDALEHGLDTCGAMVLVVSPESLASGWVAETHERAVALAQRKDSALHILPVLVREVELPELLAQRTSVEFRDPDRYTDSVWHLVWGITGEKPAKVLALEPPAVPPAAPAARADTAPGKTSSPTGPNTPRAGDPASSRRAITQP